MAAWRVMTVTGVAVAVALLAPTAWAKGDFEVVISGPGLRHPITLESSAMSADVRPGQVEWSESRTVPPLVGTRYQMDFYDIEGSHRQFDDRWWYYPGAAGALDGKGGWVAFSQPMQAFILDAIDAKPIGPLRWAILAVLAVIGVVAAMAIAGWMDRRFPRGFPRKQAAA